MVHGYAQFEVKSVDADSRVITGTATTPEVDRKGDIVDPMGITFANPLPLLLHHDTRQPVGIVTLHAPTKHGLTFTARLPDIPEPGGLRDRVNEAWQSIKAGLIRGVSIGFRPLDGGVELLKTGGLKFNGTEVLELSLVVVPANAAASIEAIKSFDTARPSSASGSDRPASPVPASGHPIAFRRKTAAPMTTQERKTAFVAEKSAKVARMNELMSGAAADTLDAASQEAFDTLAEEVKAIESHLARLEVLDKQNMAAAITVKGATPDEATRARDVKAAPVISVRANVPMGTAFVRAACAQLVCKGNVRDAAAYAEERWKDSTPEVALYLKAAIAAGTTTDATWASPLVNQNISGEFIELLRPATILGKIPNLRTVPFNTKVPSQTAGGTYGWVGEAKPKPVTKLAFSSTSLGISKAAGIIVLTKELVMLSNPTAEALVRADMVAGIAQFLDSQFIDPAVAAVAGVNPASITNGAPTAAATTNPLADVLGLINHFVTNNIAVGGVTFIMSAANALSLTFRSNLDGSPEFPGITIEGGTYKGLNFITSQAAGTNVIALQPQQILYADEGGVSIDASEQASLQMDSAPASPADATTVYVSLWQTNSIGLRAERFVNWAKANANAVKYLTATAWPAPSAAMATRGGDDTPEAPPMGRGGRSKDLGHGAV